MPFRHIRRRLQFTYLTVLYCILGTFAIGVRTAFSHSLNQQLVERLTALGSGATLGMQQAGHLEIHADNLLPDLERHHQTIQWFDAQGHLLGQQGSLIFKMPFNPQQPIQRQFYPSIQAVTIPVLRPADQAVIGYVRTMQTLEDTDRTLHRLDWGLSGGIALSLVVTILGSMVLIHQVMEQIETSFKYLKQFTADASHEFRSPLTAIKSNASVALKYAEGMRQSDRTKFNAILSAATQITHLTEDLLLLARGDANLAESNHLRVNLSHLLQDLVQTYQAQANTQSIHLVAQIAPNLEVIGNAIQLTRLLTNLIDNGLKYTPAQGTVEVVARVRLRRIEIEIKDTGIGIAPQDLEHVFDRFWRADQSRTVSNPGSGLGLAIAQTIVKQHRGSLKVKSQLQQGSCFTVHLPEANERFNKESKESKERDR